MERPDTTPFDRIEIEDVGRKWYRILTAVVNIYRKHPRMPNAERQRLEDAHWMWMQKEWDDAPFGPIPDAA